MNAVLAIAGGILIVAGLVQNSAWTYLWVPGVFLLTIAFARQLPREDPRPGYITDRRDEW